jgi:hypothetical protein
MGAMSLVNVTGLSSAPAVALLDISAAEEMKEQPARRNIPAIRITGKSALITLIILSAPPSELNWLRV